MAPHEPRVGHPGNAARSKKVPPNYSKISIFKFSSKFEELDFEKKTQNIRFLGSLIWKMIFPEFSLKKV